MTVKQKILKLLYPLLMKLVQNHARVYQNETTVPAVSFYTLTAELTDGSFLDFSSLKGKRVLIVNTASDCGYTSQYERLQMLADAQKENLVVIAFPSNDFKEQEKGTDAEIAAFCSFNYGVRFPLMKKSSVVKGSLQNPVFRWLSDAEHNGWNNRAPKWNFTKYVINASGQLTHYMDPGIDPMDSKMREAVLT
jgi:glutathione peroxidase